jgi:hypothetical protein
MNSDLGQKVYCIDGDEVSEYGFLTYNGSSPVQMNYTRGKSLTDGK